MSLRDAWEAEARSWFAWARKPGHDSYWQFHRDRFLQLLSAPSGLTLDIGCGEGRPGPGRCRQRCPEGSGVLPRTARKAHRVLVLFVDEDERVLIVRPTYKQSWEIPGGMVEENEPPHQAATREVAEEIGLDRPAGRLLCVDWVPPRDPKTDGLMFLFDGGVLDSKDVAAIVLPPEELSEYAFVDPSDLVNFFPERIARRLVAGLAARDQGTPRYLVDGRAVDGSLPVQRGLGADPPLRRDDVFRPALGSSPSDRELQLLSHSGRRRQPAIGYPSDGHE